MYKHVWPGAVAGTELICRFPHRHVSLIKIQGKEFEFEPIRLRSVRPFIFEDVVLSTYHDKQTDDRKKLTSKVAVTKYLKAKVSTYCPFAGVEDTAAEARLGFADRSTSSSTARTRSGTSSTPTTTRNRNVCCL